MTQFSRTLESHEGLQNRFRHSKEFLAEVREGLGRLSSGGLEDVCIFAAGSLGRFEAGRRSDLDVFFIKDEAQTGSPKRVVSRLQEIEVFADLIRLNENLKLPPFSGDGRFLKVHELADVVGATGDSVRDDSENLFTARLLLLLESQWLSNEDLYERALQYVLENYFRDGVGRKDFRPLFLLNDVLRYWRTLCLNYERDRTLQKRWWKKNLNLKFSRKLTVFSTVLAIVSEQIKGTEDFIRFARAVPLERLASALDAIGDQSLVDSFSRLLDDYEGFLAAKSFAELESKNPEIIESLREKAQFFGDFFCSALQSSRLNQKLVKYVLI